LDYCLAGVDIRYAVLQGSRILPTVSIGAGFNYLSGGVTKKIDGMDITMSYPVPGGTETLKMESPTVGIQWETKTLDLKAQVSKTFAFITPYAGFGASHGWSKAGYSMNTNVEGNLAVAKAIFEQFGIYNLSEDGFSSIKEFEGWSFRAFGGFSMNLAVLRFDLTGLYNIMDNNYGVTLGTRIQL
jgi:hypothetical protein